MVAAAGAEEEVAVETKKGQLMKIRKISTLILLLFARQTLAAEVDVSFKAKDFPLAVKLYEPNAEKSKKISETKVIDNKSSLPVTTEIHGAFKILAGESKSLVMVIENTTNKDMYFFVAPHTMHPDHASAGFYFECLCNHSVYKLPAGKTWYRVLRLNLIKDSHAKTFKVEHQIIGLAENVVKEKYAKRIYNAN